MKLSHFFTFLLVIVLFGCEVYNDQTPGFDSSSDSSEECENSGAECSNPESENLLELFVTTTNPFLSVEPVGDCSASSLFPGEFCFDISGFCNEGGFISNYIEWSTSGPQNTKRTVRVPGACKRGRFHIQVSTATAPCSQHLVELELVGKDILGKEHRNAVKAKRSTNILNINAQSCF